MITKTAMPVMLEHTARTTVYNHSTPSHHYLNAEIVYKSVKPGCNLRKIRDRVVTDASTPDIRDTKTVAGASAKRRMVTGARLETAEEADRGQSLRTVNYKTMTHANGDKRVRYAAMTTEWSQSQRTQDRLTPHAMYRTASVEDSVTTAKYGKNCSAERHGRGIGSKYMNRFIDTDTSRDEISALN
jgi:hypothetical protein